MGLLLDEEFAVLDVEALAGFADDATTSAVVDAVVVAAVGSLNLLARCEVDGLAIGYVEGDAGNSLRDTIESERAIGLNKLYGTVEIGALTDYVCIVVVVVSAI